jgi:hypothetical protein
MRVQKWGSVTLIMVLVATFLGGCYPIPTPEQPAAAVSDRYYESLIVDKELTSNGITTLKGNTTVGGALTVTGAITGGSFSPATFTNATALTANTGVFTTSVTVAGTAVARLSGSAIDAASLKVAATPVALLQGSAIDASSLKVALTPVALLQGSAIDASSLKVALTPVALLSGSTINGAAVSVAGTPVAVQVGALAGKRIICGQTVITGTGTIPHGLATPSFVTLGQAQDVTGDGARLSFTNATGAVTVKAWNSALTPAPATTPVAVDWCVNGTP